jgi:hypothetical protein
MSDGMLGLVAGHHPSRGTTPGPVWVMALMPLNMPAEAHCQEDRGINADSFTFLALFGIFFTFQRSLLPVYAFASVFISYLTLSVFYD